MDASVSTHKKSAYEEMIAEKHEAMSKDQRFDLHPRTTVLTLGISWRTVQKRPTDIDTSMVLLDRVGEYFDSVHFAKLTIKAGGVFHSGDNVSGRRAKPGG